MIDKITSDIYTLECDICGNSPEEDFASFYEAVDFKTDKSNGWISRKTKDGWMDICPECHEEE